MLERYTSKSISRRSALRLSVGTAAKAQEIATNPEIIMPIARALWKYATDSWMHRMQRNTGRAAVPEPSFPKEWVEIGPDVYTDIHSGSSPKLPVQERTRQFIARMKHVVATNIPEDDLRHLAQLVVLRAKTYLTHSPEEVALIEQKANALDNLLLASRDYETMHAFGEVKWNAAVYFYPELKPQAA